MVVSYTFPVCTENICAREYRNERIRMAVQSIGYLVLNKSVIHTQC